VLVRRLVTAAALAALLTGCGKAGADPGTTVQWPAAAAGRACQLLDYDEVTESIGTRFDTAAGANAGATLTCALTVEGKDFPDLTLAVAPTDADELIFKATLTPSGSTKVNDLGRIAYRVQIQAANKHGPTVEIGWLSDGASFVVLKYTFPAGADAAQVSAFAQKMIALAHKVDEALGSAGAGS
jgi:hypothetical protein